MKTERKNHYYIKLTVFFSGIVLLLLISLTAFWLQRTFYETDRFTEITSTAINEESSRQSIGSLISNNIFEGRPALKSLLGDRLSGYIAGLLGSDISEKLITRVVQEAQLLVTSPRRDPLVIDLTTLKSAIVTVQNIRDVPESEQRINVNDIPDQVTIIDTSNVPNIYAYAVFVFWLGPITFIAAISLLLWWVFRAQKPLRLKRIQLISGVIIITALVGLLLGPLFEPAFISIGRDAPSQTLLRNLYEGFTQHFQNQAILLGLLGTVSLLAVTLYQQASKHYKFSLQLKKK